MQSAVVDAAQRSGGLDPQRSFCVTAPAGSGKTELLIQRYLTLLARVEQPQSVLAITFTRKAAAEMRSRIVAALAEAAAGERPEGEHHATTYDLASAVLEASMRLGWSIEINPAQLNIRTIDGLCNQLTRQLPVLSRFGGPIAPVDDANALYQEATELLLSRAAESSQTAADLKTLLLLFDNNWQRLRELLEAMLARRDQWLVALGIGAVSDTAQQAVEEGLQSLCVDYLERADLALAPWKQRLLPLLRYAADNLGAEPLQEWPECYPEALAEWRALIGSLLTGTGDWRKKVDKRNGFPAGKGEAAEQKADMHDLLATLADSESSAALLASLNDVRALPVGEVDTEDWESVLACVRILPVLAAQLSVVFQQRGAVDHTQVALAALEALGDDDAPTDLALKLDYQLQHILVDEFQDTAVNQFELVRRLTRGWKEHNAVDSANPKTLFIVGDGMQSIYGFRDADVSLFIKAKQQGIGDVGLDPLVLQTNFRSEQAVVDWNNRLFASAFPPRDDVQRGEIAFSPASAFNRGGADDAVEIIAFEHAVEEAAWIADDIAAQRARSDTSSIAVLVRRRADLRHLLPALRERGLSWQAPDIDRLAGSEVVRDLETLCRALYNPLDRLSWLALLRAPWCGLALADLLAVAQASEGTAVWSALHDGDLSSLSDDGRIRLERFVAALDPIIQYRERLSPRDCVEESWLRLEGNRCVAEPDDLQAAAAFFSMLTQLSSSSLGFRLEELGHAIDSLFATPAPDGQSVALMTLHKAKGLEFDHVYIPNLAHATRADARPLLLWDDVYLGNGDSSFLLALSAGSNKAEPSLYDFLFRHRKARRDNEATRLLYVGATRAVQRLRLTATLAKEESGEWKRPPAASLLSCIWEQAEALLNDAGMASPEQPAEEDPALAMPLRRLKINAPLAARALAPTQPQSSAGLSVIAPANIPQRPPTLASAVGNVVHRSLERLALTADSDIEGVCADSDWQGWWRQQLTGEGVTGEMQTAAIMQVQTNVNNALQDERGQWILKQAHADAKCEWTLTMASPDGAFKDYVIDRSFVENGTRWIIDYKTAVPDHGEPTTAFINRMTEQYRGQLTQYRELLENFGKEPVRCALYFTALPAWRELD